MRGCRGYAIGEMPVREKVQLFIAFVLRVEWEPSKSFTWRAKISLIVGKS
jgi:hypothetical protein